MWEPSESYVEASLLADYYEGGSLNAEYARPMGGLKNNASVKEREKVE